jgi:rhamnulokinase
MQYGHSISVAAVDMGASSGRVFHVRWDGNRLDLTESHRFTHGFERLGEHYYWQPGSLFREILNGLQSTCREFPDTKACGIDFWGVDHALLLKDGRLAHPIYAYRDERTRSLIPDAAEARLWYDHTGVNINVYNTNLQLMDTLRAMPALREVVESVLFLPNYMNYLLSGKQVTEVSIASTSQMLKLDEAAFDAELIEGWGIPARWFSRPEAAGQLLGNALPANGLGNLEVALVPGHDTSCAFEGAPGATDSDFIVSSGTWVLAGAFSDHPFPLSSGFEEGITHERCGDGSFRPCKILLGLWLVEKLLESFQARPNSAAEWGKLDAAVAEAAVPEVLIETTDVALFNPEDMKAAIDAQLMARDLPIPGTLPEYLRLVAESIAESIAQTVTVFEESLNTRYKRIILIGGGARNAVLCSSLARRSGLEVHAFPVEAAVIGNAAYQLKALGAIDSIEAFRRRLPEFFEAQVYA